MEYIAYHRAQDRQSHLEGRTRVWLLLLPSLLYFTKKFSNDLKVNIYEIKCFTKHSILKLYVCYAVLFTNSSLGHGSAFYFFNKEEKYPSG
jgi:hypothetical protein